MRWRGNASAIPVLDPKASSLCIEDVDIGFLSHGSVIKTPISRYFIVANL